jgi:hypothetical protein
LLKTRLFAAAFLLLGGIAAAQSVSIQFEDGAFKVVGWNASSAPPESVFHVYIGAGDDVPAMLGSYAVENNALVFHPRFPLTAGAKYRAVFEAPGSPKVEATFDGPKKETNPETRVEHVYPSTDVFPSNELRMYIYFSKPMNRGEAWQHIHLNDESGKPIDLVFLRLDQELWDPDYKRLTVLFDPGRIKRGLVPATELGPPLVEGKHYTLVIDRDWHDARGVPLVEGFQKSFRAVEANRATPDPKLWRMTAPKAGTSDPVIVTFPKPMDYALLQRLITVQGVAGDIAIGRDENEWRYTPRAPWKAGTYHVVADVTLEDISGNHLDRPFDVDKFDTVTSRITTKTVSLPFTVR